MSIATAFGCTLGVVPHMVVAITGLAAILTASAIEVDENAPPLPAS